MDKDVLVMTKGIKDIIQNSDFKDFTIINELCHEMSRCFECGVVLVNKSGRVLCNVLFQKTPSLFNIKEQKSYLCIETQLNEQFKSIYEPKLNMSLTGYYIKNISMADIKKYTVSVFPTIAAGQRNGTLILYKNEGAFSGEHFIIFEFCVSIISLIIAYSQNEESIEETRKTDIVKSALGTLSFSELEAVVHIFQELDGSEGIIVASKVADKAEITRSVIVNALRKLEGAGVIESRSLGMKGTFIKVVNDYLMEEMKNYSSLPIKSKTN